MYIYHAGEHHLHPRGEAQGPGGEGAATDLPSHCHPHRALRLHDTHPRQVQDIYINK